MKENYLAKPFALTVSAEYEPAFLYLNVRGAVAEKWAAIVPGRHTITNDAVRLFADGRMFSVGLTKSRWLVGQNFGDDWQSACEQACEFICDCLTVLRPSVVKKLECEIKYQCEMEKEAAVSRFLSIVGARLADVAPMEGGKYADGHTAIDFKAGDFALQNWFTVGEKSELQEQYWETEDLDLADSMLFLARTLTLEPATGWVLDERGETKARKAVDRLLHDYLVPDPANTGKYLSAVFEENQE